MVTKSPAAEVVQLSVVWLLPVTPLAAVAPAGERLSMVSAFALVSLPAWLLGPAQAVTGAVIAYSAPGTAGIAAWLRGVTRTLKLVSVVVAVMPATAMVLDPASGAAVEPSTALALSVIASRAMPLLVDKLTVMEEIASVPALVCRVNRLTSVAAAPGAMLAAAGSVSVARVVVGTSLKARMELLPASPALAVCRLMTLPDAPAVANIL